MSLGYTGYCKLFMQDEFWAVYQYSGENWNDGGRSKNGDRFLLDGLFSIKLSSFEEPEIHERVKRLPAGRKKIVVKRIPHVVSVYDKFLNGEIIIEQECKNTFVRGVEIDMDYIVLRLLYCIYEEYQVTGKVPETMAFIQ